MEDSSSIEGRGGLSRRAMLRMAVTGGAGAFATACGLLTPGEARGAYGGGGRLRARPHPATERAAAGLTPLGLDTRSGRDGLLYVPTSYRVGEPAPLVLVLHGAGGRAQSGLAPLEPFADELGLVLLAPDSRSRTWDVVLGGFGPDVDYIDAALAWAFARCDIDPARVAISGFSDGASYALSLGLTNGDLFRRVVAFSPGFMSTGDRHAKPPIFISHGRGDDILPIDSTSRRLVPQLVRGGYAVTYREFDGPHMVPSDIAHEAAGLIAGRG